MVARLGALLLALSRLALEAQARLLRSRGSGQGPACRVTGHIFEIEGDLAKLQERIDILHEESDLALLEEAPKHRLLTLPHHLVIETPKPAITGLRAAIQNESAGSFHRRPRLTFVTFDAESHIERSPHGVPTLRSMFLAAIQEFPQADTYTYFNSDIAVDRSFIDTADAVDRAVKEKKLQPRFLVVGRRTNVDWDASVDVDVDESSFMQNLRQGTLFSKDAEDYFMVSKDTWNWEDDIPAFIVGHRGYDNWLVGEAAHSRQVDLVDATGTLRAMHLTDSRIGNKEGLMESADGRDYNMNLMGRSTTFDEWVCGTTDAAQWATRPGGAPHEVVFARRMRTCFR